MSEQAESKFSCGSCNRIYVWKPALAGKRVKCKCGQMVQVPAAAGGGAPQPMKPPKPPVPVATRSEPEDDDLYAMADMEARAAESLPPMVMAASGL